MTTDFKQKTLSCSVAGEHIGVFVCHWSESKQQDYMTLLFDAHMFPPSTCTHTSRLFWNDLTAGETLQNRNTLSTKSCEADENHHCAHRMRKRIGHKRQVRSTLEASQECVCVFSQCGLAGCRELMEQPHKQALMGSKMSMHVMFACSCFAVEQLDSKS